MLNRRVPLFVLVLILCAFCIQAAHCEEEAQWESFKMSYVVDKAGFDELPTHRLIEPKITTFISLPNIKNPAGFAAGYANGEFKVDLNGDGSFDGGTRSTGMQADFNLTFEDGAVEKYSAWIYKYNIEMQDKTDMPLFRWRRSCCWRGKVKGEMLEVFDDNSNGLYNDLHEDSIRVGKMTAAAPYTGLIVLKGELYECKVSPHGNTFEVRPYKGAKGMIDASAGIKKAPVKVAPPTVLVFESRVEGNRITVNVDVEKPTPVPVGKYTLKVGILSQRIFMVNGDRPEFEVVEGQTVSFPWGGPYKLFAKVYSEMGGYELEPDPDSARRGRLKQNHHVHPTLKAQFPVILGEHGEQYVGNPMYADLENNCFAEDVDNFQVLIFDSKKKQVNKGRHIWKRYSNRAFGFEMGFTFDKYQCSFPEFRGLTTVQIKHPSKVFGDLEYTAEVDVQYSDK